MNANEMILIVFFVILTILIILDLKQIISKHKIVMKQLEEDHKKWMSRLEEIKNQHEFAHKKTNEIFIDILEESVVDLEKDRKEDAIKCLRNAMHVFSKNI